MESSVFKINSCDAVFAHDGSTVLNIEEKVSLLKIQGSSYATVGTFDALRDPSSGAITSDLKMLAYKNTSGAIAVHDIETGELILKHAAVKQEGCGLYFVHQNRKILSSTWACDIYLLDIINGSIIKSRIGDQGEFHGAAILPGTTENEFFVLCSRRNVQQLLQSSTIFKFKISENEFDYEPVCTVRGSFDTLTSAKYQNQILFTLRSSAESKLHIFDPVSNTAYEYMDIQQIYVASVWDEGYDVQYVTYINATVDGKYLMVVCRSKVVMIIDTASKKCIRVIKHDFISNVLLFNDERNLWVGTWEKTYIYDFEELVGKKKA